MTSVSDVRLFVIQANQDLQKGKKFPLLCTVIVLRSGLWDIGLLSILDDIAIFAMQPWDRPAIEFQTQLYTHYSYLTCTRISKKTVCNVYEYMDWILSFQM